VAHDLSTVTAAILAGGLGTRLRSIVADRPKVLAGIRGRPFLSYLLDQIDAAGVKSVTVCTGYMGEQVRSAFGDTYGNLRLALPLFESDPVLVLNGDSFCDLDLKEFWHFHRILEAVGSLALTEMDDTRRYGRVLMHTDGTISLFAEKINTSGPGWINAGIYLLSQRLLLSIPEGRPVSLEQEVFPSWTDQGLSGYCHTSRFLDIGTPESYGAAEQFFSLPGS